MLLGSALLGCESCDDRQRRPSDGARGSGSDAGLTLAGQGGGAGQQAGEPAPPSDPPADNEGDVAEIVDGSVALADAGDELPDVIPEPDGGSSVPVQLPPWTVVDYLQCYCNDDSTHEMCFDYDVLDAAWQEVFCGETCAPHLGLSAIGAIEGGPFCDAPKLGGPDRLRCRCADGHEASLCADLACFDEAQRDNACHPTCEDHGGIAETECKDYDYGGCLPTGGTLTICGCDDGEEVRMCTSRYCNESLTALEECGDACLDKGGAAYSSCILNDASCM